MRTSNVPRTNSSWALSIEVCSPVIPREVWHSSPWNARGDTPRAAPEEIELRSASLSVIRSLPCGRGSVGAASLGAIDSESIAHLLVEKHFFAIERNAGGF